MESTEKTLKGKVIVIGILALATAGAALTWMKYTAQAPSTADARFVDGRIVLAIFDENVARNVREGAQATVTLESSGQERFAGIVQSVKTDASKTTALIVLRKVPPKAIPGTQCDVTIDTSVARELPAED